MEDRTKITHGGWCKCCDGKDENCRCMCHRPIVRYSVKAFFALVILIFVFSAGVFVGKLSCWWHSYKAWYGGAYGAQMMQPRQNMMQYPGMMQQYPTMNPYQQWVR